MIPVFVSRLDAANIQFHKATCCVEPTKATSGWWLGKKPSEKYDFVNWDENRNPINSWENAKLMATKPPTGSCLVHIGYPNLRQLFTIRFIDMLGKNLVPNDQTTVIRKS